jgi:rRNA biogenesis protein RRP5
VLQDIHQKIIYLFADIETISRFAMLEFKHGEPERGKTLLDNVLISYPKRTDIWSMYVDVLAKNGDLAAAR